MSDAADFASESEEQRMAVIMANRNNRTKLVSDYCYDCDAEISAERQEATGGTCYCVDCQQKRERVGLA